jgi:chromosome segregation ATPase
MNSHTNIAVVSKEQEDFLAFEREFEKSVNDLAKALAVSTAASKDAANISNKGTWKMVWGSLNGNNDKELAEMTGNLATSLTVTQTVLQMVMKISHRKNGFLKQFHEVLVNKIANLTKDTKTLDQNQRDATVVILEEIKTHVSGQLAQHDMVDEHHMRLDSIDRYIEAADLQAFKFEEQVALLSSNLGDLRQLEKSLAIRVDAQEARGDTLDAFATTLRQDLDVAATSVHALGEQAREIIQRVSALRSEVSHDQRRLSEQERLSGKTGQSINELQSMTSRHGEQLEALNSAAAEQRALHEEHRAITDQQLRQIEEHGQMMEAMHVQMASQKERIEHLEGVISRWNSVTRIALRYVPTLVALGLAGAALLRTGSVLAR